MKDDDLENRRGLLLFHINRSIRYHNSRRYFFHILNIIKSILTILFAGITLYQLGIKGGEPKSWFIGICVFTMVIVAADLVLNFSACANTHNNFKNKWIDLEAACSSAPYTEDALLGLSSIKVKIEHEEPAVYEAVNLMAHNIEARALDLEDSEIWVIPKPIRATRHLYPWSNIMDYVKRKSDT